jgi:hypothetical protein
MARHQEGVKREKARAGLAQRNLSKTQKATYLPLPLLTDDAYRGRGKGGGLQKVFEIT